jgi:hypothetical protein
MASPYFSDDVIGQQYRMADMLQRQPPATSWAGVLAQGLGAVGGNLVRGSAQNALQSNQAMRQADIQRAAGAQDVPTLSKVLLGSQVPELQTEGLRTHMKAISDDPNREYRARAQAAGQYGLTQGSPEWRNFVLTGKIPGSDGNAKFSLNPIYGTDENGNPVAMQLNSAGGMQRVQTPEGVTISKTPIKMDAGTHFVLLDPITRTQIGIIPKDVAGEASAREQGKGQGVARVNLPLAENNANRIIKNIDAVLNDPYLPSMVGPVQGRLPNITAKSQALQSRLDQLQGQTFLQAFNDLRGGGQITEKEGEKATAAYNRLANTRVGTAEYITALRDFRNEVANLLDIARRKAGVERPDLARPASKAEYEALPRGARFIDPEGVERVKP